MLCAIRQDGFCNGSYARQTNNRYLGVLRIGTPETRIERLGQPKDGTGQVGITQSCARQVDLVQIGLTQFGIGQ